MAVYEDNDQEPITGPDLHALETGETDDSQPGPAKQQKGKSDKTEKASGAASRSGSSTEPAGKALSGGLAAQEAASALSAEKLGAGYRSTDNEGARDRIRSFVQRNRRKGIAGACALAVTALLTLAFGAIVPYELVHIEKDALKDVAKLEQRMEKKSAQKEFQKIINRLKKKSTGSQAEKDQINAEDASGQPLTADIDKFPITDADVVKALAGQGIYVQTDSAGNFTGLKDGAGKDITNEVGTNSEIFDAIDTALPEWQVTQLKAYEPLMTEHAGSSFEGLPEETTADNTNKAVDKAVTQGASESEIISAEAGKESDSAPANTTTDPNTTANVTQDNKIGGDLGSALDATNQALANGETGAQAVQAGVSKFNIGGDPLLASTLATTACNIRSGVSQAAKERVPTIMSLLIRHFNLVLTLADQLKKGKLTGGTVNKVMQLFNGDSSAQPTTNDPRPEASLPFTSSAAWQRISGGTVDSNPKSKTFTPDISKSALPTANSGTQVVNEVNGVLNAVPGINLSCSALTGTFGFLVQGIAGAAQLFSDLGSFGVTQGAITAGIVAAQESLQRFVLPDIIKYFTPVGLYGGEDSVQWMNNSHVGGLLAFSDYARNNGGQPLTNGQTDKLVGAADESQRLADQQQSWADRTFATSNPDSLVSRLAVSLPLGLHQTVTSFASFFANLPANTIHVFGKLLTPGRISAASTTNSCEAYGLVCYGLPDDKVNKYDIIQNEQYLYTSVSYNGASKTRIDMAGDPSQYQNGIVDSSSTDLYHCFQQGFADGADPTASTTSPDDICASMGSFDSSALAPTPMTDDNVAVSYCDALTGVSGSPSQDCINAVKPQLNDDIGHFQQYILDLHDMTGYNELAGQT